MKLIGFKQRITKSDVIDVIIENYYFFIIAVYLASLKVAGLRMGIYASIYMIAIMLCLILRGHIKSVIKGVDRFMLLFVVYCLAGAWSFFMQDIPLSVYIGSVSNGMLPIIFYYAGKRGIKFNKKSFYFSVNVCCLIGTILVWRKSIWYVEYCRNRGISYTRLSSAIGSVATGTLTSVMMVYTINDLIESKGKKGKLQFLLSLTFLFLSMQRSAWIVAVVSVLVMHYYVFVKWNALKMGYLFAEAAAIAALCILFRNPIFRMMERWMLELASHGNLGMIESRSNQWIMGIMNSNIIVGTGFGTRGQKAVAIGIRGAIADSSWFSLLCEIGIVGLCIFIYIIFHALRKGWRQFRYLYAPTLIILIFCLQAIGSNVFTFQLLAPLFWMSIGEITGYSFKKEKRLHENSCILSATIS